MTETTARLALPLLQPGQAQKELFHNEALARIDIALAPAVIAAGLDAPPADPAPGECWITGDAPTGAWTGRAGMVAGWTAGGWRFVSPRAGMMAWDEAAGVWRWHDGAAWIGSGFPVAALTIGGTQVVGPQQPAASGPSGGATIDAEARDAIETILTALRNHGLIAP